MSAREMFRLTVVIAVGVFIGDVAASIVRTFIYLVLAAAGL